MIKKRDWLLAAFIALAVVTVVITLRFFVDSFVYSGNTLSEIKEDIDDKAKYVFLSPNKTEKYWVSIAAGTQDADADFNTDTLLVQYDGNENEYLYIQDAINSNADGIIMKGDDSVNEQLQLCRNKGIPVVFYDSDFPESGRDFYVGVDNYRTGTQAAGMMAEKLEGEGQVLVIVRNLNAMSQVDRIQAIKDVFSRFPDLEVAEYIEDGGDIVELKEKLKQAVSGNPDLKGILCMEEAASDYTGDILSDMSVAENRFCIIALDFSRQSLSFVKSGMYDAVLMQDTRQIGYEAVKLLSSYDSGSIKENTVYLDNVIITKENADEYEAEAVYPENELDWNSY